ncbi:MAG: iron ABC transporter permease [Varibaculum sp.]|nr:iron ABC transporter permease [Varibaculum sp.]
MSRVPEPRQVDNQIELRARRRLVTGAVLVVLLLAAILVSMMLGQFAIGAGDVMRGLLAPIGLVEAPTDPLVMATLWNIRFPRIVLALLVGAGLAVAGAVMQAVFSNPLAEPGVIGVSAGAAVGSAAAMVFVPYMLGGFSVPLAAFITGMLAAFVVYSLSLRAGRAEPLMLVLTGIAVTAVATALVSFTTYLAPATARDQIVFWQMGSLAGASWANDLVVAVVVALGLTGALLISGRLDVLALGESAATHVGINVSAVRIIAITLAALLTAASVAYAGVIAFVGLIVPHLVRLIVGPVNRYLIPLAILGGALLLTIADLVARTLISFADLPIGIFTALVGGPMFFIILRYGMRGIRSLG